MTRRIQVWSTRNLSYMARVTLVNSVLMSIHSYWAQITILPKKMLQEVERICRAFLWKGVYSYDGSGPVAWSKLCVEKKFGGMGIRNIHIWNKATIGKFVWAITAKKYTLLVKWIHSVYIMDKGQWEYEASMDSSWYWRKIVDVKDCFKEKISQANFISGSYSIKKGYGLLTGQVSNYKVG